MTTEPPSPTQQPCRLCGGRLSIQFSLRVLEKYDVTYLYCEQCESLQTEAPYWLSEAYATNLAALDTGAAQRNLANLAAVYCISRTLGLLNVVDFGGGDGLLCRLLRDYGINCFVRDKFAKATYAQGYSVPNFSRTQLLLAFEVFEHFERPLSDIDELFRLDPDALVISTALYTGQGPDWWYLTPETGQHIFFYSEKALRLIAQRAGYQFSAHSRYCVFTRPQIETPLRRAALSIVLNRFSLRLISAIMRLMPTPGVANDFDSQRR